MFNKPLLVNTVLFCISYINDLIGKPKGWIATRQNLELTIPYVMNKNDEFVFKKNKKHCSNRNCRLNISVVHFSWYGRFWWTAIYQSQRVQPTQHLSAVVGCVSFDPVQRLRRYLCTVAVFFFFSVSAQSSYIGRKHNYFKINIDTKSLL